MPRSRSPRSPEKHRSRAPRSAAGFLAFAALVGGDGDSLRSDETGPPSGTGDAGETVATEATEAGARNTPRSLIASGCLVEVELVGADEVRTEHFALFDARTQDPPAVPAGVERWVRMIRGTDVQLETDLELFTAGLRILRIERDGGRRSLWREIGPKGGRTLLSETLADGRRIECADWHRDTCLRVSLTVPEPPALMLHLLEAQKSGGWKRDAVRLFDPLGRRIVQRTVLRRFLGSIGGIPLSLLRLEREDGAPNGEFLLLGAELIAYRRQEGGAVAVRISPAEYARLRELYAPGSSPG